MTQNTNASGNLTEVEFDQAASEHSKNAIFIFLVTGVILIMIHSVTFFQLKTLVFFLLGIFVASLASIPMFKLKLVLAKQLTTGKWGILIPMYWIADLVWDILVTYLFFVIVY